MKKLKKLLILFIIVLFIGFKPVSAITKLDCNQTLNYGSTGSNVKTLQTELNNTIECNLDVDGIFGEKTKSCIINFQKQYNLKQDGIANKNTCNKLNILYTNEMKKNYVVVIAEELNIRENAGTKYSIKQTAKRGEKFQIYGEKKIDGTTWYKIKINQSNNKTYFGYISGEYAKKDVILLNINEQRLTYYKSGKILMDISIITGTKGTHDTPTGHYILNVNNKINGTNLTGSNDDGSTYNAYVNYWMPFITERGIGFHDASWRSTNEFNNETYKYNGSHGCVNMQTEDAKTLYQNVNKNTDVIIIDN